MKNKKIKMNKVTLESMQHYVELRKEYMELKEEGKTIETSQKMKECFDICENFIVNVINKDKEYYTKLSSYKFSNEDLLYCM